jgi:hypothetical protein
MEHFTVSDALWRECIFPFLGEYHYRYVGAVSRDFRRVYLETFPSHSTSYQAVTTLAQAALCYEEVDDDVRRKFCFEAARHKRLDVFCFLINGGIASPLVVSLRSMDISRASGGEASSGSA